MPRKVLIVDDNEIDRAVLSQTLENEFTVLEAEDGKEAFSILINNPYGISAVVVDAIMPIMDGFELVKKIRSAGFLTQLPIIVVTASTDKNAMMDAIQCGANNFIAKPCDPKLLLALVRNNVHLRETAAIVNVMQRDMLTGIYNRDAFMKEAARQIQRHDAGYYIMSSFDVNHFKVINDQYGVRMGENVLKHLGSVFDEGFSSIGGICCRISDDRFAVLFPTHYQHSEAVKEIHQKAAHVEGLPFTLSFRVGRYLLTDLSVSTGIMYDRAVLAGETIKDKYEDGVAYYDDIIREYMLYEQHIVSEMEKALANGEFEVWFQPQHNHSTGALIGSEALVRWRKNGKIVYPGDFIPIFEKNGFIYNVDKYVWRWVCKHLRRWVDEGRAPLPVSVNISRYDLIQKDFIETICGLVEEYGLPADLLRLEVTESAFAESPRKITEIVKKLIGYGFVVEIDDFGSGYSSLNTLKDVPAQILKLDMRFFQSDNSQRGGNIVESVVRMAKWLGMSVIAEGIEKQEQADYLHSIGCEYIQGFLYARPMPVDDFELHCEEYGKESKLISHETVDDLNQNTFWDPSSMDTLIFNSYVGSACILEYKDSKIEMLRATKHYVEMLGNDEMSMESAVALDWGSYLEPQSFTRFEEAIKKSEKTKETVYGEFDFIGIPGCPHRTVIRGGIRVIASSGARKLVYCINENITAQREASQKALQLVDEMQTMMSDIPGGFGRIQILPNAGIDENDAPRTDAEQDAGEKYKVIFCNDGFCKLMGLDFDIIMDKYSFNPIEGVHPGDVAVVRRSIADMKKTGEPQTARYRIRNANEDYVWVTVSGRITKDQSGDVFLNLYFTDETLRERESRYREMLILLLSAIMEETNDCEFAKDKDFRYICCSQSNAQFAGFEDASEMIGKSDYELFSAEIADQLRENDLALIKSDKPMVDFSETIIAKDGTEHHGIASKHILRDSTGAWIGIYGVSRQID